MLSVSKLMKSKAHVFCLIFLSWGQHTGGFYYPDFWPTGLSGFDYTNGYTGFSSISADDSNGTVNNSQGPGPTQAPPPNLGIIWIPDNRKEFEQPKVSSTDPTDDQINAPITVNGRLVYKANSCQWYNRGSDSRPNKKRKYHCRKAAGHFYEAGYTKGSSQLCNSIDGADCFQFINHTRAGRCYAKVTQNDGSKHYVLLLDCVNDFMKSKNNSTNANPPPESPTQPDSDDDADN